MFNQKAQCSRCKKIIEDEEVVYIKMHYPRKKGMTEIRAYLQNEGIIICEKCSNFQ